MFASTNVLTLMQFFPAHAMRSAQMKSVLHQIQCLPLRAFVGFLFSHQYFNLSRKESADGSASASRHNFGLAHRPPPQTNRHVLSATAISHIPPPFTYLTCSTYNTWTSRATPLLPLPAAASFEYYSVIY